YRSVMIGQLFGSAAILAFVPTNIGKLVAFIALWCLTFKRWTRGEWIFFFSAAVYFTYMDVSTLAQGIFWFNHPDYWAMPCYEPLLWGYLLINARHAVGGPTPKSSWKIGLIALIVFMLPYFVFTDQTVLFYVTLGVFVTGLFVFKERYDHL